MKITKTTSPAELEKISKECGRCGHCCSFGSGWVLDSEIKVLAEKKGMEQKEFIEKHLEPFTMFNTTLHRFRQMREKGRPYGHCVFREKDMTCGIQEMKPLHCRVTSCRDHGRDANEWFIINHFVNTTDPESMREWGVRLRSQQTIEGGDIEALIPDSRLRKKMMERDDGNHTDKKSVP